MNTGMPILIPLEQEQFWAKLRELVQSELERHSKKEQVSYSVPGMTQKPLYKASEVCTLFAISRQTLHTWVKEGKIRPYKVKSRVYYLAVDIENLVGMPLFPKQ